MNIQIEESFNQITHAFIGLKVNFANIQAKLCSRSRIGSKIEGGPKN